MINDFYTDDEMAAKWGITKKSLGESISRGTFPIKSVRLGGKRVFPRSQVLKAIDAAEQDQLRERKMVV